jgi:mannose-6-phosphate isomerase
MEPYPLKSVPIFKHRIWGGRRLAEIFGKDLPPGVKIGESWELADLPYDKSLIANGPFQGRTIASVVWEYPHEFAGSEVCPSPFPLLIKFLDAQDVLSVQVHPDAQACSRMGKGEPKTECWYIIAAAPEAVIYKGFKKPVTQEQFAKALGAQEVESLLAKVPVKSGECHFLPAGTPHAIGGGLLIAEIQTPSDTTYRVFDWNRLDDAGKSRLLHIEEALESIHFDVVGDQLPVTLEGRLVDCDYFKIDKGSESQGSRRPLDSGSMKTLVVLSGGGTIEAGQIDPVAFRAGDCILIPAALEGCMTFRHDSEFLTITL